MINKAEERAQNVSTFFSELASHIDREGGAFMGFDLSAKERASVVTMLRRNARIAQGWADEYKEFWQS